MTDTDFRPVSVSQRTAPGRQQDSIAGLSQQTTTTIDKHCYEVCRKAARRYGVPLEEVDEVAQRALISFWKWAEVSTPRHIEATLSTICRNAAADYFRALARDRKKIISFDDIGSGDEEPQDRADRLLLESARKTYVDRPWWLDFAESTLRSILGSARPDDRIFAEVMARRDCNLSQTAAELGWTRKQARCSLERLRKINKLREAA